MKTKGLSKEGCFLVLIIIYNQKRKEGYLDGEGKQIKGMMEVLKEEGSDGKGKFLHALIEN